MIDDSDMDLEETRSEPVETPEPSKEFEIPPSLPSDYSSKPPNSFDHIVDANQKSLTTTSWGNSVHVSRLGCRDGCQAAHTITSND